MRTSSLKVFFKDLFLFFVHCCFCLPAHLCEGARSLGTGVTVVSLHVVGADD